MSRTLLENLLLHWAGRIQQRVAARIARRSGLYVTIETTVWAEPPLPRTLPTGSLVPAEFNPERRR